MIFKKSNKQKKDFVEFLNIGEILDAINQINNDVYFTVQDVGILLFDEYIDGCKAHDGPLNPVYHICFNFPDNYIFSGDEQVDISRLLISGMDFSKSSIDHKGLKNLCKELNSAVAPILAPHINDLKQNIREGIIAFREKENQKISGSLDSLNKDLLECLELLDREKP
jgi:hypothetical protein